GRPRRQLVEDRDVERAEALPLGREPAGELRVAVDVDGFEEVAGDPVGDVGEPLERDGADAGLEGPRELDGVDGAVGEVELDLIRSAGDHPAPPLVVEDAAELAQAPAELAARIVGHVPEEVAEARARYRPRAEREVCEERADLSRARQRHRNAAAGHGARAKHANSQGGNVHLVHRRHISTPLPTHLPMPPIHCSLRTSSTRKGIMIYDDISQTIGRTPVVRINHLSPKHVKMYVKIEAAN